MFEPGPVGLCAGAYGWDGPDWSLSSGMFEPGGPVGLYVGASGWDGPD
jgi:hypothetical protein